MKKYFIALVAGLLAVSCSQQDDLLVDDGARQELAANAISFGAVMGTSEGADTRAEGETTIAELKDAAGTGFGVFAAHTGINHYADATVSPDFMYNQQVGWDNGNNVWTYTPVKYWPNGEGLGGENESYLSFFGYAPYSDMDGTDPATNPAGYCISGFSQAHAQGDPWLTYRLIPQDNLDKQVDLLYAKQLDMTKPTAGDKVELAFNHALACVGDHVKISADDVMKAGLRYLLTYGPLTRVELVLTEVNITYTLAEKGRLVLWNRDGAANWQPVLSEDLTTQRVHQVTATLPMTLYSYDSSTGIETSVAWEDSGNGVFFIPMNPDVVAQKATISLQYKVLIDGDEHKSSEAVQEVSLDNYATPGNKVALKVNLTAPMPDINTLSLLKGYIATEDLTSYIGKAVDSDGNIEGAPNTAYDDTKEVGIIAQLSQSSDVDSSIPGSRILVMAAVDVPQYGTTNESFFWKTTNGALTGIRDEFIVEYPAWSTFSDGTPGDGTNKRSGKINGYAICSDAANNVAENYAIYTAYNYNLGITGVTAGYGLSGETGAVGHWFLPTVEQMINMGASKYRYDNSNTSNGSYPASGVFASMSGYYWSSSEYNASSAWWFNASSDNCNANNKGTFKCKVRPVFAY